MRTMRTHEMRSYYIILRLTNNANMWIYTINVQKMKKTARIIIWFA